MATEKMTTSINPATGATIGYTRENSVQELHEAVRQAAAAQTVWAATSFARRQACLLKIRDFIVNNADRIAAVIASNSGKTRIDALSTEVLASAMAIHYHAKHAKKILKRKKLRGGSILTINKRSYVDRVPLGVVGIISPWNYPFSIPMHEVSMALCAGNAVVLKVATQALLVGEMIAECVNAAGLPAGLFTLVNIPGSIAGDAFLEAGIHKLFFTGSVQVGKKLLAKSAERLIPLSLELGGNDAMIVLSGADLTRAANCALWAGLSNSGQSCAAVERIYVEASVYDRFLALLKEKTLRLRQGVDIDFNLEIGSLTTRQQQQKLLAKIADARTKGANVCSVPPATINDKGYFLNPVILENVSAEMEVMNDEVFGPVLAVQKVADVNEAVTAANQSRYGLTASVWTRNKAQAHAVAARLQVGSVMINDHLMSHGLAETPWGGFKESGLGRTHGYLGLEEMTQPRTVTDDILPGMKKNMWWYPHDKSVYDGLKSGLEVLFHKKLARRAKGLPRLVKVFLRSFRD